MKDTKVDPSFPIDFVDSGQQPQPDTNAYVHGADGSLAPASDANLVVAKLVEDKPTGPTAFGQLVDLDEKIPLYKRKKFWVFASVFLIIVVGVVVVLTTRLTFQIELNKVITESPSSTPSLVPSTFRDGLGIWQRLNSRSTVDLLLALEIGTNDDAILQNVSDLQESPQFKAADWIVNEDELALDLEAVNLIQRYALAVLYFATSGYQWHTTLNPKVIGENATQFLSESSECDWIGISCDDIGQVIGVDMCKLFEYFTSVIIKIISEEQHSQLCHSYAQQFGMILMGLFLKRSHS